MMVLRSALVVALALGVVGLGRAEGEISSTERLRILQGSPHAAAAQGALRHAQQALDRSVKQRATGAARAAERADAIARAALELAQRQVERAAERERLRAARRRLMEVEAQVKHEREAIENLLLLRAQWSQEQR